MPNRILDVTAYTTLDFVEAVVRGHGWEDEGTGIVDAYGPKDGDGVVLEFELDPSNANHVDHHADSLQLTPDQARQLADDLVDAAAGDDGSRPRRLK